jgi:hypothetical protein
MRVLDRGDDEAVGESESSGALDRSSSESEERLVVWERERESRAPERRDSACSRVWRARRRRRSRRACRVHTHANTHKYTHTHTKSHTNVRVRLCMSLCRPTWIVCTIQRSHVHVCKKVLNIPDATGAAPGFPRPMPPISVSRAQPVLRALCPFWHDFLLGNQLNITSSYKCTS